MPVIVACQSCGRKLCVSDDLLGHKVKCPSCGQTFEAEEQPADPPKEDYLASRENGTPVAAEGLDVPGWGRRPPAVGRAASRVQVRRDCEPDAAPWC